MVYRRDCEYENKPVLKREKRTVGAMYLDLLIVILSGHGSKLGGSRGAHSSSTCKRKREKRKRANKQREREDEIEKRAKEKDKEISIKKGGE